MPMLRTSDGVPVRAERLIGFGDFLSRHPQVTKHMIAHQDELYRFVYQGEMHIVYQSKIREVYSPSTRTIEFLEFFLNRGLHNTARPKQAERKRLLKEVIDRDGTDCFFCKRYVQPIERSLEHILELSQGGSNDLGNLALAHESCNHKAQGLSVVQKVKRREEQ